MLHLTKWVGEQPYFIARDSARRAIVVSIRGTMSIQDCITDCMYKPVLLNADTIGMPQYTGCQLHCHAGVVTATNFILSDLEKRRRRILEDYQNLQSARAIDVKAAE